MGTRGMIGIQAGGRVVGTYNHYDSYPSWLGATMAREGIALAGDRERVAEQVAALRLVDEAEQPTPEERAVFTGSHDENVSTGADWYAVLRGLQGSIKAYLDAGVMPDGLAFASDSLFCEWAYIVDLDAGTLEVYKGLQQAPPTAGRFAGPCEPPATGYYPVNLVRTLSLSDLAQNPRSIGKIMQEIEKADADGDVELDVLTSLAQPSGECHSENPY